MNRRRITKILAGLAAVLVVAVAALWVATEVRYRRTWDEIPYPDIQQRTDAATLARGEYLAWHVVGCDKCHLPHEEALAIQPGERPPLKGGWQLTAPGFGTLNFPNITPDLETGIGDYTAPELGRVIRTGVLKEGAMGFTMAGVIGDMTDEDLEALVSYIMSREPVRNPLPPDEIGPMFKVLLAWMIDPYSWPGKAMSGEAPPIAPTVERGRYLAMGPANCVLCHSPRNPISFEDEGPKLSGANPEPDMQNPGMEWAAPNLTPDPKTGFITSWSEAQFIERMTAGRAHKDTQMPWESFRGMATEDLQAIYRYLMSLDPVEHQTGPTYREEGWAAASL
jgi:mono/diheme cytochrome c family protein